MKRFIKGCAIAALIMCISGFIIATVASSVAGRATINRALNTVTGGRAQLYFFDWWDWGLDIGDELEDLSDDLDYEIGDSDLFDRGKEVMKGSIEKYSLGSDVSSLEIEAGGCQFETKVSKDENFYVEAKKAAKFQGYVKGDTLYIKHVASSQKLDDIGKCKITLYIPEAYFFDRAEIEMGAGTLTLGELNAEELSLDVGAGQITVDRVEASEADISVGAGQIQIHDMEVRELSAEIGMGEFIARGDVGYSADLECSMGNIELMLEGSQSDFNYQIDSAMGNMVLGEQSFGGLASERRIDNGAGKNIEVDCSMGNITIYFTE